MCQALSLCLGIYIEKKTEEAPVWLKNRWECHVQEHASVLVHKQALQIEDTTAFKPSFEGLMLQCHYNINVVFLWSLWALGLFCVSSCVDNYR